MFFVFVVFASGMKVNIIKLIFFFLKYFFTIATIKKNPIGKNFNNNKSTFKKGFLKKYF